MCMAVDSCALGQAVLFCDARRALPIHKRRFHFGALLMTTNRALGLVPGKIHTFTSQLGLVLLAVIASSPRLQTNLFRTSRMIRYLACFQRRLGKISPTIS